MERTRLMFKPTSDARGGVEDIVVLPSIHEGMPLTAIEAPAIARPVVATCVDGTPEVIRDGRAGRDYVLHRFDRDTQVPATARVYRSRAGAEERGLAA